jgi:hypothetical protein
MGQFYELLTKALFGGYLYDSVLNCSKNGYKGSVKPDVVNNPKKEIYEAKANRTGHQMNLLDNQINSYKHFQIFNEDYKIYYIFYRHGFKKIKNVIQSRSELQNSLSSVTYAAIKLPLDIIIAMWNRPNFKRYETEAWPHCTRINSPFINKFLFQPKEAIKNIGLDSVNFKYNRWISPPDLTVEKQIMSPFLIIDFESKNYLQWAKEEIIDKPPF